MSELPRVGVIRWVGRMRGQIEGSYWSTDEGDGPWSSHLVGKPVKPSKSCPNGWAQKD